MWLQRSSNTIRYILPNKCWISCHRIIWNYNLLASVYFSVTCGCISQDPESRLECERKVSFPHSFYFQVHRMFSMIWKKLVLWKIQCFFWLFLFNILREWILPPSCLSTAGDVLCSVPGLAVEVSSVIKRCFLLQ